MLNASEIEVEGRWMYVGIHSASFFQIQCLQVYRCAYSAFWFMVLAHACSHSLLLCTRTLYCSRVKSQFSFLKLPCIIWRTSPINSDKFIITVRIQEVLDVTMAAECLGACLWLWYSRLRLLKNMHCYGEVCYILLFTMELFLSDKKMVAILNPL